MVCCSETSWYPAVRCEDSHMLCACCRAALGKLSGAQDGQSASARQRNLEALIPVRNYTQRIGYPMPQARCETLCFVVRMHSVVCLGRYMFIFAPDFSACLCWGL